MRPARKSRLRLASKRQVSSDEKPQAMQMGHPLGVQVFERALRYARAVLAALPIFGVSLSH